MGQMGRGARHSYSRAIDRLCPTTREPGDIKRLHAQEEGGVQTLTSSPPLFLGISSALFLY